MASKFRFRGLPSQTFSQRTQPIAGVWLCSYGASIDADFSFSRLSLLDVALSTPLSMFAAVVSWGNNGRRRKIPEEEKYV